MCVVGKFQTMAPTAGANNTTTSYSTLSPVFPETQYLITISGALSIFGAIFIFITHCLWQDIRSNSRRILAYISFADLLVAVCHIVGVWYVPPLGSCITQAFFTVFAINSSTFWTASMAIYLHITTVRRQIQLAEKMMFWFHLICWLVPLTMACVALVFGALGRSGFFGAAGWCWIQTYNPYNNTYFHEKKEIYKYHRLSHEEQVLWMILTNFMWKIIAFCIIIILYTSLRLKLREAMAVYSNSRDHSERRAYEAAAESGRKLMLVPLLYIFLYIWGLVRFIVFVFDPHLIFQENVRWLTAVQGIGDTSQGFINFLFYCFLTKRFMDPLRKFWSSFSCCRRCNLQTVNDRSAISSLMNDSTIGLNRANQEREPLFKERKPSYNTSDNYESQI